MNKISSLANKLIASKSKNILALQNRKTNTKMCIIKLWAMILVVTGHCVGGGVTHFMENWVHPMTFGLPLFVVASGYFYKKTNDNKKTFAFIKDLFVKLCVPYFIWNIIYGIFWVSMKELNIIANGDNLSFNSLFVRPWVDGHQFGPIIPAWFLLSLFLVYVATFLVRKFLSKLHILNDEILLLAFFGISVICIYISQKGYSNYNLLGLLRAGFLLPYLQGGYVYRKHETALLKHRAILISLLTVTLYLIMVSFEDVGSIVVFMNFTGNPLIFTLIVIIGIIIILTIADILAPSFEKNKVILYAGNNTFTIMMHHAFFIFLINLGFYCLSFVTDLAGFDVEQFKNTIWYVYTWRDYRIGLFYTVFVMAAPLVIKYFSDKFILYLNEKNETNSLK